MLEGIDVSDVQGIIDWKKVKNSGVAFAFCKATDGETFVSKTFRTNWQGIKDAGLIRGAYHYCHLKNDPIKEATHFVNTVGKLSGSDMLVLDIEDPKSTIGKEQFLNWTLSFMETVEKLSGVTPILYTGGPYFDSNGGKPDEETVNKLIKYPLWLAAYTSNPDKYVPFVWKKVGWTIWQRSGDVAPKGESVLHVPGIRCVVDRNQYKGTLEEFTNFAQSLNHAPIEMNITPIIDLDFKDKESVIDTSIDNPIPVPSNLLDDLLGFVRKFWKR
jgi:GH25 family lysozyme M1 (1,4-beta-N-acetylmuramidase)